MRVISTANLFLLTVVLIPSALTAQESEGLVPLPIGSFVDVAQGPVPLRSPQSSGEKSALIAGVLNAFVLPGVGNFYAGNTEHGLRHLALAVAGFTVMVVGMKKENDHPGEGEGWVEAGGVVWVGNWAWSIFSGIEDARATGRPGGSGSAAVLMLRPQLVALGLPSALPYAPELAQRRLGLQLVRVTF